MGPNMNYGLLLVGTFVFFLAKQLVTIMNMHDSFRFLNAKDSKNARKAALLAKRRFTSYDFDGCGQCDLVHSALGLRYTLS